MNRRSPIEALLCVLKETNWAYNVKVKESGAIENLFFAHPGSIHLAWINHHMALLDSTYKTNQYQLPLLHVIGQAASNRSFSIAFCFLAREDAASYLWAVGNLKKHVWRPQRIPKFFITDRDSALRGALADVFPNSQANLCTWHLNKNITTSCKKFFSAKKPKSSCEKKTPDPWTQFMSSWGQVTKSKTPDIYYEQWASLKAQLSSCPSVLEYIKTSILPVKELFVVAWACQHPHLRNLNTSCVESGHAYVKTSLKTLLETCSQSSSLYLLRLTHNLIRSTIPSVGILSRALLTYQSVSFHFLAMSQQLRSRNVFINSTKSKPSILPNLALVQLQLASEYRVPTRLLRSWNVVML